MSSLRAFLFCRNQRRPFTLKIQITSTTRAMGRKKVTGQTGVSGEVPLCASQSYSRYPRTALRPIFKNVFQQLKNLSLLLVLKEDPPSSVLEEKKSEQPGLPQTLQQEFSLINVQIRNVNVEVLTGLQPCSPTCWWQSVGDGALWALISASKELCYSNKGISLLAFLFSRFSREIDVFQMQIIVSR